MLSQKLSTFIDPISITLLRFIIAIVLLLPFISYTKKFKGKIFFTFKRSIIISFLYVLFFLGMFKALEYTSAINTGTIFTLVPLLTAIFVFFVFKQKIYVKQYLVYLIGILGTSLVIFKEKIDSLLGMFLDKGDIIFLFSIMSLILYSISAKYFHKKDDKLIVVIFMTLVGGSLWMLLALSILEIPLQWEEIENELFIYVIYLSIIATLIISYLYQKANLVLSPKILKSYSYLNPASISLLLFMIEGKSMNLWIFIAILISSIATFVLLRLNHN